MPIPGQEGQEGGPQSDALSLMNQFPNPNGFLLRNIFGEQSLGWSSGIGTAPFSYNFSLPTIPAVNPLLPWVPGPQMGWSPSNISFNFGGGFGSNPENGSNGTNGTNGSGGPAVKVSYYTDAGDVTVDPCEELYFQFDDGEVVDDGAGKVTVYRPGGGAGGVDGIVPITVSGNDVALSYDNIDSFQLNGANELQLKNIIVTQPTDVGVVTAISTDDYGRIVSFTRQAVAVYKITNSTYQGNGYWTYTMIEQTSLSGGFPFFNNGSAVITGYNFLETCNTSGSVYGYNASTGSAPVTLTDYTNYVMRPVPTGLVVHVWKFGSRYFFSAPNPITGTCAL